MSTQIEIYTDGSCINNGKPDCVGGWSCVFFLQGKMYVRYGHLSPQSSNNKAEITGVLYAIMKMLNSNYELLIHSDSQYVVKSINEWRHGWKKRGYAGIKNADLLIPLFEAWDQHGKAKIEWVRGHVGNKGNEIADQYAGYGSRNVKLEKVSDSVNIQMIEKDWKPNGTISPR